MHRNRSLFQLSMFQLSILWLLSMLMLPVLLIQGLYVRRTALRLADASHPDHGCFEGDRPPVSLLAVGDSVIAGTGIESLDDSLAAQTAKVLAKETGRAVSWRARGINGDRLADLIDRLQESGLEKSDVILVSIGVNDVTALTGLLRWQMQLTTLLPLLRVSDASSIVLLGVPPMEYFTALPQPLRWVLGIRAAMLNKGLQQLAGLVDGVTWLDVSLKFDSEHLATDGYHPNELAVLEMADQLGKAIQLKRQHS